MRSPQTRTGTPLVFSLGFYACIAFFCVALWQVPSASGQGAKTGYEVTAISPNLVDTPDYNYSGTKKPGSRPRKWLEVEVDFRSDHDVTEELTFKYYILLDNKALFVGEASHINIMKGKDHRSVVYIAPNTLDRLTEGKTFNASAITNIGVEVLKQGQLVAGKSLKDARGPWWQQMPQTAGFVLSKSDTPFAPLDWDRYAEPKPKR